MEARNSRVREYFYGTLWNPLHPHSFDVKFADFKLYRIGVPSLPDSCMPAGTKTDSNALKLVPQQPSKVLSNSCIARVMCTMNYVEFFCLQIKTLWIIFYPSAMRALRMRKWSRRMLLASYACKYYTAFPSMEVQVRILNLYRCSIGRRSTWKSRRWQYYRLSRDLFRILASYCPK